MPVIMVGEVAMPAMNINGASDHRPPARFSGSISMAMPVIPARKRETLVPRRVSVPKSMPATAEPIACSARTVPATGLWPRESAKATVTISSEPKTEPVNRKTSIIT
ncbi:hypothetical protein GCM10020000_77400 [Streptomyces olivoverticillatus]